MLFPQDADEEPTPQPSFPDRRNPPLPPVAQDQFAGRGRTVLIIDQSPTVRLLIQKILQEEHFHVIVVDALSGLANIANYHPHLILLSIQQPRLDGYHLCRIIRKNPQLARIPVIMLGKREEFSPYAAMRSRLVGSTDFLTKPFDSRELVQMVKKYLPT